MKKEREFIKQVGNGYLAGLEINYAYAKLFPNNCAIRERTADGLSVGPCTHYLADGISCPRHGTVKGAESSHD